MLWGPRRAAIARADSASPPVAAVLGAESASRSQAAEYSFALNFSRKRSTWTRMSIENLTTAELECHPLGDVVLGRRVAAAVEQHVKGDGVAGGHVSSPLVSARTASVCRQRQHIR